MQVAMSKLKAAGRYSIASLEAWRGDKLCDKKVDSAWQPQQPCPIICHLTTSSCIVCRL